MRNIIRILLSAALACNPLPAQSTGDEQALSDSSTEANQSRPNSIDEHLEDFWQRQSQIETMLQALKHIFKEPGQAIAFEAIEKRSRLQIGEAETLYRKGNHFTGRYLMDITYQEVLDLVIQSRDGSTLTYNLKPGDQYEVRSDGLKADEDFDRLNASIDALMQALVRVSEEKNMQHSTDVVQEHVAQLRKQAFELKASNDALSAIDSLRKAYVLTTGALSALREGETLIMSLNFANKKEEYEYYLQKTESQKFALSLLAELNPGAEKSKQLQHLIDTVEPLLEQAMKLAAMDDHDAAVPIMDKAYTRLQSGLMMALTAR